MTLDTLLAQPLAPVRDDGFSAAVILRLRRTEERRRQLLWGAGMLAVLPLLTLLPATSLYAVTELGRAASSPVFASAAGLAVLLWALRPARARF